TTSAQPPPGDKSDKALLEALMKKIDEQNAKIDALSQQILKLEQQVSAIRPGVIIGETPSAPSTSASTSEAPKATQSGNNHVVAKGETLTSIAKMHKVSVEELQKFNHIENDRKLQIGQTTLGAVQEFMRLGEINEQTFLINSCDGLRRQIGEMALILQTQLASADAVMPAEEIPSAEPAASGMSIDVQDRIRDLEQSLL